MHELYHMASVRAEKGQEAAGYCLRLPEACLSVTSVGFRVSCAQ